MSKQQLEQRQLKEQLRHYNAMILSQEQVKGLRHDMKNHLLSVYAKIKRQEYTQCLEYIENLLNAAIATEKFEVDTGNTVLDAILSAKREEAVEKGIKFLAELRLPKNMPLKDNDICIIFGNALDNAIEACEKVDENPYISVSMVYDGDSLICRIENSCINQDADNVITTKSDIKNHGIGRMNMRKSMNGYDTVFHITREKNKYILSIVFMEIDY
jgi:sensor histidine kinase regulating citrate/malate metabolism